MRANNTWRFNVQLASSEIVFRRIGRNEMSAIDACAVYVAAQKEYAEKGFPGKGVCRPSALVGQNELIA